MDWLNIKGKSVVVTGGSSGIGEAIIKQLLDLEVNVINADIKEGRIKHKQLFFVQTDVSDRTSVENLIDKAMKKFGVIDAVVNNAGINIPALLVDSKSSTYEIGEELFEKMYAINQKGVYLLSQATSRQMIKQGHGVIINMSSESGLEGSEGQSVYAATKAAINSFTRSWSKELGKYGIRVLGIAPGIMEETGLRTYEYEKALAYTRNKTIEDLRAGYSQTTTIPLGRSGKLDEIADLVSYFISDRSSYITGVTVNISGGKTRG
ncbi:SDR family oxidoreductase [Listeria monocytogenes]|nr:SDR family oxidoreductase [Listeria monocytogenes]MIV58155.1 SDR family oxidoreductase [Listeria monocytogenes]